MPIDPELRDLLQGAQRQDLARALVGLAEHAERTGSGNALKLWELKAELADWHDRRGCLHPPFSVVANVRLAVEKLFRREYQELAGGAGGAGG